MADVSRALQLLADRNLDPGVLARVAELHPELHVEVTRHPSAGSELLDWLATSPNPAVRDAVAQRRQPPASPAFVEPEQQAAPMLVTAPAYRAASAPVVAANSGQLVASGKRSGRFVLVLVGVLAVLLAAGAVVWAAVLRPSTPGADASSSPPSSPGTVVPGVPAGDFRNGATKLWSVKVSELVTGGANFGFGHDNARTQLALGPVAAGNTWLVKVWTRSDHADDNLVAIDARTGKKLWQKTWPGESDCVGVADRAQFLCAYPAGDGTTGQVLLVNAEDGSERPLGEMKGSYVVVVASSVGLMAVDEVGSSMRIVGFGVDGAQRFDRTFSAPNGMVDVGRPVAVVGEEVALVLWDQTIALDLATGDELGRFTGQVLLTGYGHYALGRDAKVVGTTKLAEVPRHGSDTWAWLRHPEVPVIAWQGTTGLTLCEAKKPDVCRPVTGLDGVWSRPETYDLRVVNKKPYLVLNDMQEGLTGIVDVTSATYAGAWSEQLGWMPAGGKAVDFGLIDSVAMEPVFPGIGANDRVIAVRHPLTGAVLGSAPTTIRQQAWQVAPGYLLIGSNSGVDGNHYTPERITVYVGADKPTAFVAPEADSAETVSVPSEIPECPGDTIRLAWATFPNGWVLVCGYYVDQPTLIRYSSGGTVSEASSVTYDGVGMYRGTMPQGGKVWLTYSPGTAGVSASDGSISQQSQVGIIWFVALGVARAQSGSFGVAPPQHTAADQVRYLAELLAKSKTARKSLASSVETLNACSKGSSGDYSSEIAAIDGVTRNREMMVQALAAAPVDLVPDGPVLLGELKVAIQHSLDADVAFATWGRGIQRDGCRGTSSAEGDAASQLATQAKTVFSEHWNRVIVGAFPVERLTESDL